MSSDVLFGGSCGAGRHVPRRIPPQFKPLPRVSACLRTGGFGRRHTERPLKPARKSYPMKPIRFTQHAREQCVERGANEKEVTQAILNGSREIAKRDRILCRYNFPYGQTWQGKRYQIKQVAPVIKETATETIVITVYTFFF
jgi:hypothetical protein